MVSHGRILETQSTELHVEYDGNKGAEIAFNPTYIADMLRALEPDAALTLEMSGDKPAVFRHAPSYLYVAVPLVPDAKARAAQREMRPGTPPAGCKEPSEN